MIHARPSLLTRWSTSLAATLVFTASPGCGTASLDTTPALEALTAIHSRLASAADEQAGLTGTLAAAVVDVATERLRLELLLDLDELLTPAGQPDREAIERLLGDGSDNALVREVRLGRLTLDEAIRLVSDAGQARGLSPALQVATEERIIADFADWQRLAAAREAITAELDKQRQASNRLLEEANELVGAMREAAALRRDRSIRVNAVAQVAVDSIHDANLRESVRSLLDAVLASSDTSSARSQTNETHHD